MELPVTKTTREWGKNQTNRGKRGRSEPIERERRKRKPGNANGAAQNKTAHNRNAQNESTAIGAENNISKRKRKPTHRIIENDTAPRENASTQ